MGNLSTLQTTKIYKKIIIIFSIVVFATLGIIIYYSFSKTVLTITLVPQDTETNFNIDIKEELSEEDLDSNHKMTGTFLSTIVTNTKTYTNTNQGEKVDALASGTVTIYNNWSDLQPLAATTRLLSLDGVLFHTKDRVDVPAGGKLENVEVYADKEGISGNIEKTTFTIPGLWEGLQEQIYAESFTPMTGGQQDAKIITQKLIDEATTNLREELLDEAKSIFAQSDEVLNKKYEKLGQALSTITLEKITTPEAGIIAPSFDLTLKLNVLGIIFDENELITIAENNVILNLADDEKLYSLSDKLISYSPSTPNFDEKNATLNIDFATQKILRSTSSIFDKDNLVNKDENEIKAYFSNFNGIGTISTKFSPFWVSKTPTLKDHIELEIQ
ncbi:MAG: hypothetical protein ACNFW9_03150 [Candidatus Kerfeldbacteria bacterium]|jgi:hypothetical protein